MRETMEMVEYPDQISLLIESLKLRVKQVKDALRTEEPVPEGILLGCSCPLCKTNYNKTMLCSCIAEENLCSEYYDKVQKAIKSRKDRDKLLTWLRYQLRKWEKVRWFQKDSNTWQSLEDEDITVCISQERDEEEPTEFDQFYMVYPAYKASGIPNSPSVYSEIGYGTLEEAYKEALKEAKKIMALPIEQIRKFKWSMIK